MALETPSRPPPLHGKCHLKFPFWFFDSVPYKEGWTRAETKQAQWAHTVTDFPFTFIQICRILKCRKCNHCNSSGFFFANTTCCKSQTGYMAAKHKLDLQIVWKVNLCIFPNMFFAQVDDRINSQCTLSILQNSPFIGGWGGKGPSGNHNICLYENHKYVIC